MLALERALRPVPRLEVDTVESSRRGAAGAFRYEAASRASMAISGRNLLPGPPAADLPEQALP